MGRNMGKLVELTVSGNGTKQSHTFRRFPVRIGRDPSYECQIRYAFISRRHARLELRDDAIVLVDEGSSQGTFVAGDRRVQGEVLLADVGNEFRLGELVFRVTVLADLPNDDESQDDGAQTVPGRPKGGNPTRTYQNALVDPAEMDEDSVLDQLRDVLQANRARARDAVLEALPLLESKRDALLELIQDFHEVREIAEVAELVSKAGVVPKSTPKDAALEGLETLLGECRGADVHLASSEDVGRALAPLHLTLKQLAGGVATLLRAYAIETKDSDIDIDERRLLAFLLDPQQSERAGRIIEDLFAMLATHHVQLARDLIDGVQALLSELAPSASVAHGGWSPWRWRARWEAYSRRHAALVGPSNEASRLFGPTVQRLLKTEAVRSRDDDESTEPPAALPAII
jgi:FHA domain